MQFSLYPKLPHALCARAARREREVKTSIINNFKVTRVTIALKQQGLLLFLKSPSKSLRSIDIFKDGKLDRNRFRSRMFTSRSRALDFSSRSFTQKSVLNERGHRVLCINIVESFEEDSKHIITRISL